MARLIRRIPSKTLLDDILDKHVHTTKDLASLITLARLSATVYGTSTPTAVQDATGSAGTVGGVVAPHDHEHGHAATIHPVYLGPWSNTDQAASQSSVGLQLAADTTGTSIVTMPYAGEIRAISMSLSIARSAGTISTKARVNGSAQATPNPSISTNITTAYATVAAGTVTFAAGDTIGAEVTTDGSWAPTTSDLAVGIFVTLDII